MLSRDSLRADYTILLSFFLLHNNEAQKCSWNSVANELFENIIFCGNSSQVFRYERADNDRS